MKKENDELTDLFQRRLKQAQMEVRDDFWESLQRDLYASAAASNTALASTQKKALVVWFYKLMGAASVLLVLGLASSAFWYFSPKEEIQQAFTQVESWQPSVSGTLVEESGPLAGVVAEAMQEGVPNAVVDADTAHESVSVRFSITIRQQVYGRNQVGTGGYQPAATQYTSSVQEESSFQASDREQGTSAVRSPRTWAFKVSAGSALPKSGFHAPVIAGVSVERSLGKRWALEAGLQYHRMDACGSAGQALQTLAVPVKLNWFCADTPRWTCYASVGGAVEKGLDQGFQEDPLRLSVSAGVGVAYKMNDKLALFAEPAVSHHFDTDTRLKNLRTERATNFQLLCGIRMTY